MKLLFVCSGNICRSPMAAEYFRYRAAHSGLSHIVVDSAGTLGIEGARASRDAVEVMSEIGVDLSAHRSKGVTREMLRTSDLVLVMSHRHLEELAVMDPDGPEQRLLLRAFEASPRPDANPRGLKDPIGRSQEFYRALVPLIVRCSDHLILHLKHSS